MILGPYPYNYHIGFPPRNIEGGGGGGENNIIKWLKYSFLINILGKLHFKPHTLEVILN